MAERMTCVHLPSLGHGVGFAEYRRQSPEDMIRRLRSNAQIAKEEAERILAAADSDFAVETYTGINVQRNTEQLWPVQTPGDGNHG